MSKEILARIAYHRGEIASLVHAMDITPAKLLDQTIEQTATEFTTLVLKVRAATPVPVQTITLEVEQPITASDLVLESIEPISHGRAPGPVESNSTTRAAACAANALATRTAAAPAPWADDIQINLTQPVLPPAVVYPDFNDTHITPRDDVIAAQQAE